MIPRVEKDPVDGHPVFFHRCTSPWLKDDKDFERIGGKLPLGPEGWQWEPDGSLNPSIKCLECGTHGYWRGPAGWVPC